MLVFTFVLSFQTKPGGGGGSLHFVKYPFTFMNNAKEHPKQFLLLLLLLHTCKLKPCLYITFETFCILLLCYLKHRYQVVYYLSVKLTAVKSGDIVCERRGPSLILGYISLF